MSTAALAREYRERARALRRLAARIGQSRALTVYTSAGPDTWIGPTPQHCYDSLRIMRDHLLYQRDALDRTALSFDLRAAELERLPAPHTIGLS
jgi:hypothetical protein